MPDYNTERVLLPSKRYRALVVDYDVLSGYSQETEKMYCLTDFQAAWLRSITQYMAWSTRWKNSPFTRKELQALKAELDYRLMDCNTLSSGELTTIYNQIRGDYFNNNQTDFNNDGIPGVNPDAPTTNYDGDGSPARQSALCLAVEIYVKSYIVEWQKQVQSSLDLINVIQGTIGLTPLLGQSFVDVISGLVGVTQAMVDATNLPQAVDDVICCMIDGLEGQAVSDANFAASLNSCSFAPETQAGLVRQVVAADLGSVNNWLSFIDALGKAFVYTDAGVQFDCPCVDPVCELYDFTIDEQGWIPAVIQTGSSPSEIPAAQYETAQGWTSYGVPVGAVNPRFAVRIIRTGVPVHAEELTIRAENTVARTIGIFVYTVDENGDNVETVHSQEGYSFAAATIEQTVQLAAHTPQSGYRVDLRDKTNQMRISWISTEYEFCGQALP